MEKKGRRLNLIILVVCEQDEKRWKELIAYFRRKGADIRFTSTAKETYNVLRDYPVNIMIVDYDHPSIKGLNLLKKTKQLKPHVELIFLSEKASLSKAIQAMREGAYDFYEFPVNSRLISTVIEKAIEKQVLFFEKAA